MGNVVSFKARTKKTEVAKLKVIKCSDCDFNTKDPFEECDLALDTKGKEHFFGDSGRFVCRKCGNFMEGTIFDGMVEIDSDGNIYANIPASMVQYLADTYMHGAAKKDGFHFGAAILNALRNDLQRQHLKLFEAIFEEE